MGKKLELGEPIIKGYLHYAYQLGILSCYSTVRQWIYSNYIQLICDEQNTLVPLQFYMPNDFGYNWSLTCPIFEQQVVSRDIFIDNNIDFLKFLEKRIDDNWYILCYINEKYIEGTAAYHQNDFNHMIMVYGYDNDKGTLQVIGYNSRRQYASWEVPKSQFVEAFLNNKPDFSQEEMVYLYRVREDLLDLNIQFEMKPIVEGIKSLLLSQPTDLNVIQKDRKLKLTFGLDAYDKFTLYLMKVYNKEVRANHIPLHVFMDHKLMMINRLKYIMENRKNLDLNEYIQQYMSYVRILEASRNSMMKSGLTNDYSGILNIIEDIKLLKKQEEQTLTQIIQVLQ